MIRQRPAGGDAALFVDTAPRPVNQGPGSRSWPPEAAAVLAEEQGPPPGGRRVLALALVSAMLLYFGYSAITGNMYSATHQAISERYATYLKEWDDEHHSSFRAATWTASFRGRDAFDLPQKTQESKHVKRRGSPGPASRTSISFYEGIKLFSHVFPSPSGHHAAAAARKRKALWQRVSAGMQAPVNLTLTVTDAATGVVSQIDAGHVLFVRSRTIMAGGEARCTYEQSGKWEADYTCTVQEYLSHLCFKVRRDESGRYSLDGSWGGAGCSAAHGWQPAQWKRLTREHRLNGITHLPAAASNHSSLAIRHWRDPSVLESQVVKELAPNMEQRILLHALGMAACFIAVVLLVPVAVFGLPRLKRRAGEVWRRLVKGGRGSKDTQDDE